MYTVLILSRNAMDSYHDFDPITSINEKSDAVGVCTWYENANTIDTAVPELDGLIRRHQKWRAVVVRTELPVNDEHAEYRTDDINPYEYIDLSGKPADPDYPFLKKDPANKKDAGHIEPSRYPMVLISQLLGGIPTYSLDFLSRIVAETEPGKADVPEDEAMGEWQEAIENEEQDAESKYVTERVVTEQKQKEDDLRRYREMCEEWNDLFSISSPPSEIVLISRRRISYIGTRNDVETSWQGFVETQSSMFWKKMGYSNICRFLTFDVDTRGRLTEQADMFRFWNAVLLVAGNKINSDILKPYRLYRLDVRLNYEKLRHSVQIAINRLNYAQYRVDKISAQQQPEEKPNEVIEEKEPLTLDVPVELDLDPAIDRTRIPYPVWYDAVTESKVMDLEKWKDYTTKAARAWNDGQTAVRRLIGKTAERARGLSVIDPADVEPMTEFDKEDLIDQLDGNYTTILEEQESLPFLRNRQIEESLKAADGEVRKHLDRRIGSKKMMVLTAAALLCVGAAMGCAYYSLKTEWYIPAAYIGGTLLIGMLGAAIALYAKNRKLRKKEMSYYAVYQSAQEELKAGGRRLAEFFSHVCASMRGKSILFVLSILDKKLQRAIDETNRRTKMLSRFQDILLGWCDALQLNVDLEDSKAMEEMIDHRYAVDFDMLTTLEVTKNCTVKINKTGVEARGVYDFVECLLIEREEVYDE